MWLRCVIEVSGCVMSVVCVISLCVRSVPVFFVCYVVCVCRVVCLFACVFVFEVCVFV